METTIRIKDRTDENFNKENCIDTLRIMSGNSKLDEMPHYDTLNYYLENYCQTACRI